MRRRMKNPKQRSEPKTSEKEVVLKLRIGLPRFERTKQFISNHASKLIVTGCIAVLLAAIGGIMLYNSHYSEPDAPSPTTQASPHFTPLLHESDDDPRHRFDSDTKVLSFHTQYNNVTLTVSQQPLPEIFQSDPQEAAQIARYINAEDSFESNKGMVYIATDEESDSQTVSFATDDTLVFIRAHRSLTTEEWRQYINDLES